MKPTRLPLRSPRWCIRRFPRSYPHPFPLATRRDFFYCCGESKVVYIYMLIRMYNFHESKDLDFLEKATIDEPTSDEEEDLDEEDGADYDELKGDGFEADIDA